jgi:hypothetical protein
MPGRRIVLTQILNIRFLPLNLSLAKAYPQKMAVITPNVTAGIIIENVFLKYVQYSKV